MFLAKVALGLGLLGSLTLGKAASSGNFYQTQLKKGDIVGRIVQFYTGNAKDWRKAGVQVINNRTGKIVPKSDKRYKHLAVGDKVYVDKSLVKTVEISTKGITLNSLCEKITTTACVARLSAINYISDAAAPLPPAILIPLYFTPNPATIVIQPPAPPTPAAPQTPAPPQQAPLKPFLVGNAFWFWLIIGLLVLLLLLLIVVLLEAAKWRKEEYVVMRPPPFGTKRKIMRSLDKRFSDMGIIDYRIFHEGEKVVVFCGAENVSRIHAAIEDQLLSFPTLHARETNWIRVEIYEPPPTAGLNQPVAT